MDAIRFQAKFVVESSTRILHPGQVVVRHGRVAATTESTRERPDVDLGESVLLPSLINAHTHLELSDLRFPLPAGDSFPAWIAAVVTHRRDRQAAFEAAATDSLAAETRAAEDPYASIIQRGLHECFRSGTGLLADIVAQPWQADWLDAFHPDTDGQPGFQNDSAEPPANVPTAAWQQHLGMLAHPQIIPMPELVGLQPDRLRASCDWAEETLSSPRSAMLDSYGISPHAPYSLQLAPIQATLARIPKSTLVAMHIAESRDELQWLEHGTGAFRETFERLGIPIPNVRPSIAECLELLASQRRSLVIHGNYLSSKQIEQISRTPSQSVVYCPRTHAHFSHSPYPLQTLMAAGIRVVLGTDSRASNPDLSLWDDVIWARRLHPQVAPSMLLDAVTISAAEALGVARDFGSLEPGKFAYANLLPAQPEWTRENLIEAITASGSNTLRLAPLCLVVGSR
jgi:cytosine/adenosine deaminase-related metal-dependent hydrolase